MSADPTTLFALAVVIAALVLVAAYAVSLRPHSDPPPAPPNPPALGIYYWTFGPEGQVIGWLEIAQVLDLCTREGLGVDFDATTQRAHLQRPSR